jgi:hypothetical protein
VRGDAAAAIDRGWSVFPVLGKKPIEGSRGLHDASRDFDLIETRWPEGTTRGLAIATGHPSRVWVLDLDGPDAIDRFLDLQHEHGKIPATVTTRTRRGFHLFFRMPAEGDVRNSASKVADGIDTRGTGGYVLIAPSPHPDGGVYEWAKGRSPDELVPIEAARWLLRMVQKQPAREPTPRPLPNLAHGEPYIEAAIRAECAAVASAPEGVRNDTLNRAAHALARFVADGRAPMYDTVRRLASAAARAGLSEAEILKTVKSAFHARGVAA